MLPSKVSAPLSCIIFEKPIIIATSSPPKSIESPTSSTQQIDCANRRAVVLGSTYYIKGVNLRVGGIPGVGRTCILPNNDNPVPLINNLDLLGQTDLRYGRLREALASAYNSDNPCCD